MSYMKEVIGPNFPKSLQKKKASFHLSLGPLWQSPQWGIPFRKTHTKTYLWGSQDGRWRAKVASCHGSKMSATSVYLQLVWQYFQHRLRDSVFFIYDNDKGLEWTKHFILVSAACKQHLLAENRKTTIPAFFYSREITRTPCVLSHLYPTQYGALCMAPLPELCIMAQDFKSQCFPGYRDL